MPIKSIFKCFIPNKILEARDLLTRTRPYTPRQCPICNYNGFFGNFGRPPRIDALCSLCGSLERHRLFWLWYLANTDQIKTPILHFAPEKIFSQKFSNSYGDGYKTADLFAAADIRLNIEKIDLPDASYKTIICNHVLEHVDDKKALSEIYRILSNDGVLICSVPMVEGWDKTYENDKISTNEERDLHFGQCDHVRYYGKDFRDRLASAGFVYSEITAEGESVIRYGLLRGEKFFVCRKKSFL